MTHVFQARAELVQTVRVDHLLDRLKEMRRRHVANGRVSQAAAVKAVIQLVRRTTKGLADGVDSVSADRSSSSSAS